METSVWKRIWKQQFNCEDIPLLKIIHSLDTSQFFVRIHYNVQGQIAVQMLIQMMKLSTTLSFTRQNSANRQENVHLRTFAIMHIILQNLETFLIITLWMDHKIKLQVLLLKIQPKIRNKAEVSQCPRQIHKAII